MSKLSEFIAATPGGIHGHPCSIDTALADMDAESAADLDTYFAGNMPGVNDSDIHTALKHMGYQVGRQTIGRHRRRSCRCFKD